ncbi:MAG TPA: Gfo/Idh/MocA family oxidoreductase [Anaerolineae bacterium]|nr:Gfo/Idh/MocA family oxidoreductase [Anaerolineae bacterium]HQI84417.1 Gfo/Idh/MocA family oxidoreductase [Anaerolineae bacterium]
MDKVRFGIIGVGGMGTGHGRNFPMIPAVELTAVCDIAPAALETATRNFEVPGFDNHVALLDSGLVDAVIIATPHYFHPPIAVDAMRRGIHVISEKPMAVMVSGAEAMITTAEETGVVFAVMFQQRTLPASQAAKKLVDEGRLGPLYRTLLTDCHFRSQAYYNSAGWRATWKGEGGGVLLNQAPHGMDLFTWLAGMPSRVIAQVNTRQHVIEVEDEAAALLEYENGAIGYMLETVNEYPTGMRLELCGEYGKLVLDDHGLRFWEVKPGVRAASDGVEAMWGHPDVAEVAVELEERTTGHAAVVYNVAQAILHGEKLLSPGPEAIRSLELANAILLSGHTGQPVALPVDRAAYDAFIAEKQASSKDKNVEDQRITDPHYVA